MLAPDPAEADPSVIATSTVPGGESVVDVVGVVVVVVDSTEVVGATGRVVAGVSAPEAHAESAKVSVATANTIDTGAPESLRITP